MLPMGKKEEVQDIVSTRLVNERGGLIIFPTGVGKTKMAIDTLTKLGTFKRALIVTSLAKGRDFTWPDEILKWNPKLACKLDIICYDSMHKYVYSNYDVIIYDECHHVTEAMTGFLEAQKGTFVMAMTATLPTKKEKLHLLFDVLGLKIVAQMSVQKAVELGLISPFHITRINMKLDGVKKNVIAGSKKQPFVTTEKDNYNWLTKKIDAYSNADYGAGNNYKLWQMFIMKRLHFMNGLQSKVDCSTNIIKKLRSEDEKSRILVFSKSINSARAISPYCYHSKTSSKDLDKFIAQSINTLSVVNALNESVNLPDMDAVLMNQLNSSDLVFTQQMGRLIRFRAGFTGTILALVADNTVDENWYCQATNGLTTNKVITYDEFINQPSNYKDMC